MGEGSGAPTVSDVLDWLDAGKLGILTTALVAVAGLAAQHRQSSAQRSHERQLQVDRDQREERIRLQGIYASFLKEAIRYFDGMADVGLYPPSTSEEHDRGWERREPQVDAYSAALALVRVAGSAAVLEAAEEMVASLEEVKLVVEYADRQALTVDTLPEWSGATLRLKEARVSYTEAVRREAAAVTRA